MLPRLVLAALIFPLLQAGLFAVGVGADDWLSWSAGVADPVRQAMAGALLVGLPLAWGAAPGLMPRREDRLHERLARLRRRRLRPDEVCWPPLARPVGAAHAGPARPCEDAGCPTQTPARTAPPAG